MSEEQKNRRVALMGEAVNMVGRLLARTMKEPGLELDGFVMHIAFKAEGLVASAGPNREQLLTEALVFIRTALDGETDAEEPSAEPETKH